METILLIITVVSVAAAIFAIATAMRTNRRERERSDARAAALAAAAETHGIADGGWQQVAGEWQWVAEPAPLGIRDRGFGIGHERTSRDRVMAVGEPIPDPQSPIAGSSERLFGTVGREAPTGNRLPIFAAAALIVLLGGSLAFLNTSVSNDEQAPAAGEVEKVSHNPPLELVSLNHAREVKVLTISGTVRNPASGVKLEGLTAVVSLLDRDGALVSTKDVPLDYRALGPGEEAPFKVSVPDPGSIARYRVSFRAGTAVVPHVDRRIDTKLASARQ